MIFLVLPVWEADSVVLFGWLPGRENLIDDEPVLLLIEIEPISHSIDVVLTKLILIVANY